MRIPRFYQPAELATGLEFELDDNAVQHIARALRMRPGELIQLFNNSGSEYTAELLQVEKRRVSVRITDIATPAVESPLAVHIGQVISRGERMDYAVQKATEMGMQSMTPLFSERCEVRLNEDRQEKRIRHWQQIAISASEQSGRTRVPKIEDTSQLKQWLQQCDAELKLVMHHHSAQPLGQLDKPASVALLIGPEGGLTETEVELAIAAGFQPLALGPRVMRTETAPVAAQAILQQLWGDIS
ncbi:16S rRNA (uracil(1498)-N(3))-methyltransferase [Marinobacterium jannaschii]|uniref:16S rRNA (uracil(1498)-N(3))-methyltransferase n=1 Tax=Marinobacterium jannaschii TaxID=64970 RepID=UPI0004843328|nr:16S rRNA (uracil(1498)-N(3))-methyltransferase [Marinobacterium jannaschii]